jgi:hypothetical protein
MAQSMDTGTEERGRLEFISRRAFIGGLATTLPFFAGRASAAMTLPKLKVTKDPSCGCCSGWADHVRSEGFEVEVIETSHINPVKARLGVPANLRSCHTAETGGYVVEGHVPASAIKRLVTERPKIIGLAVPGMPVGSPGMEVDGTPPETFDVIAFRSGQQSLFARFRGTKQL